ncbi:hypothetical protein KPL35_10580 [Clostridium sp. CF011]|uniref:hypothetical protein n=1 Tax=Clostridium sp. CF011 TaxID=2843318 RepID=UPI001C0C6E20|nr:hypothetical protein [Clostridium sp. CF011]MBU3092522.1 hypothetical protein [Clostridium sp. CF011]WAG68789.1 hypothetical protein LL036_11865 [Clostridium sp. CF011]
MTSKVKNVIWMIWKNEQEETFKVGELSKGPEKYYFKYDIEGVKKAEAYGFSPLPCFPIVNSKYFSEELFRSFVTRLPYQGEKDMTSVLKEYNIDEYDDLELLGKSGGKMSTDRFEFVSPFDEERIVLDKEGIISDEK